MGANVLISEDSARHSAEEPMTFRSMASVIGRSLERNRSPWTAEDIDRLCELMARRRPVREIAAELGRTQEAVRTKAYQLDRISSPAF